MQDGRALQRNNLPGELLSSTLTFPSFGGGRLRNYRFALDGLTPVDVRRSALANDDEGSQ
jgi:hypothetical protein